jgi:hypothetical protein
MKYHVFQRYVIYIIHLGLASFVHSNYFGSQVQGFQPTGAWCHHFVLVAGHHGTVEQSCSPCGSQ